MVLSEGKALWLCRNFCLLPRQGFRTMTFERQDGSFQNFHQSWVMVKVYRFFLRF